MSAIDGIISLLQAIESDKICVHEERCVSVRNRNARCLKCVDACTSGALSRKGNELIVEPSKCIGCGTCATACPTCAIEIKMPTDADLMARAKDVLVASEGHPILACERVLEAESHAAWKKVSGFAEERRHKKQVPFDEKQICSVKCLGRVDEALILGLVAHGAQSVDLALCHCESCDHEPGGCMARSVAESASSLLRSFDCEVPVSVHERLPKRVRVWSGADASSGMDRRAFFSSMKGSSQRVAGAVGENVLRSAGVEAPAAAEYRFRKVNENGTLPQFVPERRVRVFNYLRHLGEPVENQVQSRVIGSISIDSHACSSCRMCATFCPTGALTRIDREGEFGILHRPSMCVQCRLCEQSCPKSAITVSDIVPSGQFVGNKAVCILMKKPAWQPNRPESMYSKIHTVIGEDIEMLSF